MAKFQIGNTASDVILGVYEADDKQGALDAMARDAGYRDYAHADEIAPSNNGEIVVTEINDPSSGRRPRRSREA